MGTKHTVFLKEWTEYERGWGCRPDGCSMHLTEGDARAYVIEHNREFNNEPVVPYEYTVADGGVFTAEVDDDLYARIKASKNGIMLDRHDYRLLRYPNGWKQGAQDELNVQRK